MALVTSGDKTLTASACRRVEAGIVGRDAVLDRLRIAIEAGGAVALVGPAGIGKTSLATRAVAVAGRRLRRGAALDFLQARPYLPLVRIVGQPVVHGDAAAVAENVRGAVGDAVLLLDDLQWSDPDTVEALPALAATGPLIVTVRPGGETAVRAVKQMRAVGDVIEVEPLRHRDSVELAQRLLPDARAGRAFELARASGGNPLALEALVYARTDEATGAADSLRAVIDACPHDARLTLARLGLHDPDVTTETVGVGELVERQLAVVDPTDEVHPAAELFGELALASLDVSERTSLHRRRAETVDDPGEAALHWAAAGDRCDAYAAALRAAELAETGAARAQFLTLAADNAPDQAVWSTSRRAVAAWLELGELDATEPLVARLAGHEPPTRSDAIDRELMRARLALEARQSRELLQITDATIETFGPHLNAEQRVSLLVARAAAKAELYDIAGAMADARRAIEIGEEHGVSVTKAGIILAGVNMVVGNDRWRCDLSAVIRRATRDGEYDAAFEAGRLSALAHFFNGDIEGGLAACDDLSRLAARLNNRSWDRAARAIRATNLSLSELLAPAVVDELRQLIDDAAIGTQRHPVAVLLAVAESDLGNFERADRLVQGALEQADRWRSKGLEGLLWARCEIAWNAGRLDECVATADELLAQSLPLDFGTAAAAVAIRWVEWERRGDCSHAPGPLVVFPVQRGLLDEARGLELLCTPGRERDAADAFLAAAALHDGYLRRNAVRCRWAAGEALLRAGETETAAGLLEDARETCERHGLVPLGRRVDASLRRLGATRPAARSSQTNGGLTPREVEVLTLVRAGLSTAEIAAQLHLRPSTVESHIRKSMKRLGASNRREAALRVDPHS